MSIDFSSLLVPREPTIGGLLTTPEASPDTTLKEDILSNFKNLPEQPTTQSVPELFTQEDLTSNFSKADPKIVKALLDNQGVLQEYGINTDDRVSMFMGQMAHESAGFKALSEYGGGSRYEGRADLGNTSPGDGERYKGRGIIQLTGKYNYDKYGKLIGEDLVNDPTLAADPNTAVKIAAAYWKDRGLNEKADAGDFGEITRRIQGTSSDAYEQRLNYFSKFKETVQFRKVGGGLKQVDVPLFNHLSQEEKNNLLKEGRSNEPLYYDKNKKVQDPASLDTRASSGLMETLSGSYANRKYLNQMGGIGTLYHDEMTKALQANIEAAGDKAGILKSVKPDEMNEDTYKLALETFKRMNPDIVLPNPDMIKIDQAVQAKAATIENTYNNLHYGNMSNSPSEALNSLLLYGADLAGTVGAMFSDPISAAVNLYGGAELAAGKVGVTLAANAGKAFLGFGAEQVGVQASRAKMGLSYGVAEGVANAALQAGLLAGGQAIGHGVSSLWKWGSAKYASKFNEVADKIGKGIDENIKPINPEGAAFMKRQLEDQVDWAAKYSRNPYGKGVAARVEFTQTLKGINEDLINNKFAREVPSLKELPSMKPTKVEQELAIESLTSDPEQAAAIKQMWSKSTQDIKAYYKDLKIGSLEKESVVPVIVDGNPIKFKSLEEGQAFIETNRGAQLLNDQGASLLPSETMPGEYYIGKHSTVELASEATARTANETASTVPSKGAVVGPAEDIQALAAHPELGRVQAVPEMPDAPTATYPHDGFKARVQTLGNELSEKFSNDADKTFDQVLEASNERIKSTYSPEVVEALNNNAEFQATLQELKDLRDMKSPGVMECFYGVTDVNNN